MNNFDPTPYIERNRKVAMERYGILLDENRRVSGTDIWFDDEWRFHKGEMNRRYNNKQKSQSFS